MKPFSERRPAVLRPIDLQLGALIERLEPDPSRGKVLGVTATLLSRRVEAGDSCIEPVHWAGKTLSDADPARRDTLERGREERLPESAVWLELLRASPLVGDGASPTPMVLTSAGRLYFYRYWLAERRIASWLENRLRDVAGAPNPLENQAVKDHFDRLFPPDPTGEVDFQGVAAATALRAPFALIAGGPGTGKTTTVARVLALLLLAEPDLRIALAAPTGKAAQRLGESIERETSRLQVDEETRSRIPAEATTLHRLLGYRPSDGQFSRNADRPLGADVVLIDEASMVDLLLFEAVVLALRPGTRLILLGDKHQLASVEVGTVFTDLCNRFLGDATRRADPIPTRDLVGWDAGIPAVELLKTYRFGPDSAIARSSAAVRTGDVQAALRVLQEGAADGRLRPHPNTVEDLIAGIEPELASFTSSDSPEEALDRFNGFRVLCATNVGHWGVRRLNALVERHLRLQGRIDGAEWYRLRPLLVTSNDYEIGLFNGDVGVCWEEGNRPVVYFSDGAGGLRAVSPARLPSHTTAWAMTVHKSQGSEFDRVLFILPTEPSPLLTRELIYTGFTRARVALDVVAEPEILRFAVGRKTERSSGIKEEFRSLGV